VNYTNTRRVHGRQEDRVRVVTGTREVTVNVHPLREPEPRRQEVGHQSVPVERGTRSNVHRGHDRGTRRAIRSLQIVPETREITVNVTKYVTETREGTKTVYEPLKNGVVRKVKVRSWNRIRKLSRLPSPRRCSFHRLRSGTWRARWCPTAERLDVTLTVLPTAVPVAGSAACSVGCAAGNCR